MIAKLYAIASNTFIETIRQPVFNLLTWLAIVWVSLVNPALATFSLTIGNDIKVMQDVGLATLLLYGLLGGVFSATGVITREIESQTVLTVIAKPVGRPLFLVGKYLGVTGATLLGFYLASVTFFLAARHGTLETASDEWDQPVLIFAGIALFAALLVGFFGNYFYGWNFLTTLLGVFTPLISLALLGVLILSPEWQLQSIGADFGDLQLAKAVIMIGCAAGLLTAFAVAISTRCSQVVTLMLSIGVLLLGLLSDYYLGSAESQTTLQALLYAIVPNFQFFWVGDLLTQEQTVPTLLVLWVLGYTALYTPAVLALGVALFQTREVG
jgi:ABC-2 type transport system permease protein